MKIQQIQNYNTNFQGKKIKNVLNKNKTHNSDPIKEICDYKKEHTELSVADLAKEFGMNKSTITKYLKQGTELGWCKYDAKEEKRRSSILNGKCRGKLVSQFTLEGKFIKTYPSAYEAERQTGINYQCIGNCCRGKQKSAGGFIWIFAE